MPLLQTCIDSSTRYTNTHVYRSTLRLLNPNEHNNMMVQSKQKGSLGLCIYTYGLFPYTSSKEDEIATQRAKDFYFGW